MVTVIIVLQVDVASGGHAIHLGNRQDPGANTQHLHLRVTNKYLCPRRITSIRASESTLLWVLLFFSLEKFKSLEMRQRKNNCQNCKVNIFIELKLV